MAPMTERAPPVPLLVRAAGTRRCIARKDKLGNGKKQLFGNFKKESFMSRMPTAPYTQ